MKRVRLLAAVLASALLLTACSGDGEPEGAGTPSPEGARTVRIALHPWIGYEASAAVVAYLLKRELGYKVEYVRGTEAESWKGFEDGTVDVIIENWGHQDLKREYIDQKKVAVSAGPTGNRGVIGWYVPEWMAQRYPEITTYQGLIEHYRLFRTEKSGNLGQLLAGDPSFVSHDEALIRNLKLPFKVVYTKGEGELIEAARKATQNRSPLLMYFYEPQWLFKQLKLVKVNLPPYALGCDKDPERVACDYPPYLLDKIVSARFAENGGKAYELIKNFTWTNEDQSAVAYDMAVNNMSADDAARKWIEANKVVWQSWLPS
ncbi:glycine/betaine-binding protein [Thermobispora bispora]|jgi:glycine betaine/proline transport system substrate-binding protein|uniref:ABC transporter substrate-binding protein n=1 Tax=Thermobispora bispora TaxID=2006 RepID=UPI00197EC84D|nr:ABC transporter substrate-binding protein [Thermobispora bispora]MBO2473741.1 glycine/betaine ABC transporter substrate-binding protein [Actinomycetales bacterium]MBX6168615.1 ABC transporter substrate-binding protein [Thermobispora bispora]MDI9580173.1 ABC transporter substrate-binding protein [Thermobispora sp.]QSI47743.1 glycine/betaine ABC transporter substrate-binding protein [Thermobispora bispora]